MVYLDFNATTPLANDVIEEIKEKLESAWGNPSSDHSLGLFARKVKEIARLKVADMIGAKTSDIIFTSGGTESNYLVIHSAIKNSEKFKNGSAIGHRVSSESLPHIITTNIEHDSIILPLREFKDSDEEIELSIVEVSKESGRVEVDDLIQQIKNNTCLISIMLANNETGIIQPVDEIAEHLISLNSIRLKKKLPRILLHTDAAQAIGKINVDVLSLKVDYLTIVGHKFYGPRIGALYAKDLEQGSTPLIPLFLGGGQERGFRPGTENIPMIAGLGKAAELVTKNLVQYETNMREIRDLLEAKLKDAFGLRIVFNNVRLGVQRLPNTCSVAFLETKYTGADILSLCRQNVEASTGAACHSTSIEPSKILIASGVDKDVAVKTIRLSVGRETTSDDIDIVVETLKQILII